MARNSVLFINRVYPPAEGATGQLLAELAAFLAREQDWQVTVLTGGLPGHPRRLVTEDGLRIERVARLGFVPEARTWRRALAYLLLYPSLLARALQLPSADVVVTKTDPPLQLVLGAVLKRLTGARAVHWAQDLYPEVAEQLGVVAKGGALARGLRGLSTAALRVHDYTVAVGRCMKEQLLRRGLRPEQVATIPNWPVDTVSSFSHKDNVFRAAHDLDDRFVVMYSGNMGRAHPFEVVLEAATQLQEELPHVLFCFVGSGPRLRWLKDQVARRRLRNVQFMPFQPKERLAQSLSAADLHLVTMRADLCGLLVPSKIYGVLAAGRPCLFLGPTRSEAARLVREHRCGAVMPHPTGEELVRQIRAWHRNDRAREAAGRRARSAVEGARSRAFDAFESVLQAAVQEHRDVQHALA